jgi:hypothetical protein
MANVIDYDYSEIRVVGLADKILVFVLILDMPQ